MSTSRCRPSIRGGCATSTSTTPPADLDSRVGVIPFTLDGVEHDLVAAILGYEHAVGVRSGCFCAHPYLAHLLGHDAATARGWARRAAGGDRRGLPGMVRISFGCYSDTDDVDRAVAGLARIAAGDIAGPCTADRDGEYHPAGYCEPDLRALAAAGA